MAGNMIGKVFTLNTYGESHGVQIGGIIDGCPAGLELNLEAIQHDLDRRKPGQSAIVTQRKESDIVHFSSGIFERRTTGTPIGFHILNADQKSKDYTHIKDVYRPSHADKVYDDKYGHRDYRGGGRSSARETACRVVAGAIAKQLLAKMDFLAYVSSVGDIDCKIEPVEVTRAVVEDNVVRGGSYAFAKAAEQKIRDIRKAGDTVGGTVTCVVRNVPVGLGEPVFDKLHADLAKAMLSINAVKGFEYGSGFSGARMTGSQHNDLYNEDGSTQTNYSGGIQGGISNGMNIYFKVAFKPVATLISSQQTINTAGENVEMQGKGRHDPCVVPRAVPIVEAMAALVLADHFLRAKVARI